VPERQHIYLLLNNKALPGVKRKGSQALFPGLIFIFRGSQDRFCIKLFPVKVFEFDVKLCSKWLNYNVDTRKGWYILDESKEIF